MMTKKQLKHNIWTFYLSRIDLLSLIIVGIIDIWLRAGLDLAAILLLQGIFSVFIMVLEFPSGILADLTDRSTLLGYSYIAMTLGVLCYLIGSSYLWFILAEFMFAIGMAGKSGADTAHIYDSFLERNQELDAIEILASGKSLVFAGMMVQVALGGVLAALNWRLPLIIAMIGFIVISLMYFKSYEPDRIRSDNSHTAMKDAFAYLRLNSVLKLGLILIIVNVALNIVFWDYVPKMESLSINAIWFGIVLAGANGIAFLTSIIVRRYKELIDKEIIFVIIGIIGLFLFINQNNVLLLLISILAHQICRGSSTVIFDVKLNQVVNSEVRASLASLISSIVQATYFIVVLSFNVFKLDDLQIHWLTAILATLAGLFILILISSQNITTSRLDSKLREINFSESAD